MESFLTFYLNELPAGAGFGLYGPEHLLFLVAIAVGIAAACIAYRRTRPGRQPFFRPVVACACVGIELVKQVIMLTTLPAYPISQLPLHLCGLGMFWLLADAFVPKWHKTTHEVLYSLVLPGAVAALLFPDWTAYPVFNFYSLQGFLYHGLLLCYPVMLLADRQLRPDWRGLWRPALFLLAIAGPTYLFNKHFGTNFLYINGAAPGSPLVWLEALMGDPGYLTGYAGLIVLVWLVMYAPFIVRDITKSRKSN